MLTKVSYRKPFGDKLHPLFRFIKNGIYTLLAFIAFNIIITVNIPVYIYRVIVIFLAKWFRPDLSIMQPFSSALSTELRIKRSPRCCTVLPLTFNGNLTRDELLQKVRQNWIEAVNEDDGSLKYPEFKNYAYWWMGFSFWKSDPTFDLENHVFSFSKPEGEGQSDSEVVTEQELDDYVETLLNAEFTPGRSPWEIHVVENYRTDSYPNATTPNLSVMVMRLHHSLADGYSLLDALVVGLMERDLKELNLPELRKTKRTFWQKLIYYLSLPVAFIYELSRLLSAAFKECPWQVSNSIKNWRLRYAKSELIPIEKVKRAKNALGVGFTSVLLSAISAGIYKSLEEKRKNGTLRVENEEDYMLCVTAIPLPETEKTKKKRLKNNVTGIVMEIPSISFPTSVDRLKICDDILEGCRSSVIPFLTTVYINLLGWMLGSLSDKLGLNRVIATGLTNFPTKPKTYKCAGINGKDILFAEFASGTLSGNAGVGFMVVSFYPYIRLTVTAETAILSREEIINLVKYIEEEFDILCSIADQLKPEPINSENIKIGNNNCS